MENFFCCSSRFWRKGAKTHVPLKKKKTEKKKRKRPPADESSYQIFFGLLLLCGGLFKKCIKTIKADFQTARLSSKKRRNHFTRKNNNTKHITISTLTQQAQKGYFQIFGKKKIKPSGKK